MLASAHRRVSILTIWKMLPGTIFSYCTIDLDQEFLEGFTTFDNVAETAFFTTKSSLSSNHTEDFSNVTTSFLAQNFCHSRRASD
jgi:hypothetical protein